MQQKAQGFTLIELLLVIAIIAVLAVVVILVLNPVQLLAQARDSSRISDMATLKRAISLYLADVSPSLYNLGSSNTCYGSSVNTPGSSGCGARMTAATVATTTALNQASTTGGGWIPINFSAISAKTPIGAEPRDPVNNATYFYSYATNASYQFEIDANMESSKYANTGNKDVESTDGGNNLNIYETGTNLSL